ncbi:MAG: primosomal protein N' [bacterium]
MYAEVLIDKASSGIDKIFHYAIPQALQADLKIGQQVKVPFGKREEVGFVTGLAKEADVKNIKEIIGIVNPEPLFSAKGVDLARWIADYYCSFFVTALKLMMPAGVKKGVSKRGGRKIVKATEENKSPVLSTPFTLTQDQSSAVKLINSAIDGEKKDTFLLFGVTGSGKTEIYMRAIERLLEKGKSAIVLVPEIALTPQLVERFQGRFGELTAVLHSGLTDKFRRIAWKRVASGEARIVLGARSALFAPVNNLGLIVIDEEYENTYKSSDKSPRYHVREVSEKLAELNNAVVVLGSATPSIETYYRSELGEEIKRLNLPTRVDDRPMPVVEIVDLRQELKAKNFGVLSAKLKEEIKNTLENREQVILFMNRLGYFTFVMCRECGLTIECPNCSVSLVYHTNDRSLHCGRCGYTSSSPTSCPRCNSRAIKYFGTGTQRIEDEVTKIYPQARILRYDRDTTTKRGSHDQFFSDLSTGKADVLIGTQMVAKGLDIPNVTLVGVVSADTAIGMPEFRAAEHTFQLLTQVAGRAGRHNKTGKVIIQTYNPEHYAIKAAGKHDYEAFYKQELEHRRELGYPPFGKLVSLLVSGSDRKKTAKIADDLGAFLKRRVGDQVLGPAPAAISRLNSEWRYRILLKGKDLDKLRSAVRETLEKVVVPDDIRVAVDVEPMGLL